MLVEKRTDTVHAGQMRPFLSIYEAEGLAIHTKYLRPTSFSPLR